MICLFTLCALSWANDERERGGGGIEEKKKLTNKRNWKQNNRKIWNDGYIIIIIGLIFLVFWTGWFLFQIEFIAIWKDSLFEKKVSHWNIWTGFEFKNNEKKKRKFHAKNIIITTTNRGKTHQNQEKKMGFLIEYSPSTNQPTTKTKENFDEKKNRQPSKIPINSHTCVSLLYLIGILRFC